MSPKVRYGIIGCGVIYDWHAEVIANLPEIAELVAVCDTDPAALRRAVDKSKVRGYASPEALIADPEIDAVTIAVPSGLHAEIGVQALQAGKHVLTEKPIDVTLAHADALIDAARQSGKLLACVSQNRYGAGLQKLREWLDAGRLGKIVYGESAVKWYRTQEYYDSGAWRGTWALDGGGALMNQGVHYADQLRWAMGRPKSVVARMATLGHERIEVEDIVTATIEFESGALGTLTSTTCAYPGFETRLEIYGTDGSVRIVNNELEIARFTDGSEYDASSFGEGVAPDIADTGSSHPRALGTYLHWRQFDDFTRAILENRPPKITAQDGRAALELVLAVYQSARTGEAVTRFA